MNRVAVVGKKSSVNLFSLIGCETFVVENEAEATSLIEKLIQSGFVLIFIANSVASNISKHMLKQNLKFTPIISRIPD